MLPHYDALACRHSNSLSWEMKGKEIMVDLMETWLLIAVQGYIAKTNKVLIIYKKIPKSNINGQISILVSPTSKKDIFCQMLLLASAKRSVTSIKDG